MILAIDIGNTNITVGVFRGETLLAKFSLSARKFRSFKPFVAESLKRCSYTLSDIECAVMCSVVPRITPEIKRILEARGVIPVYVLGKNLKVPIKNLYFKPKQVGHDRLVCAYMASRLYGTPVISIDLGTAITFDVVSRKGEYLGGIILPGLTLSLAVLHTNTALLPRVLLKHPQLLIGKDTRTSMLSGISFGFGSLIDGLIDKLRKQIGARAKAVVTGGDSLFIKHYCKRIDYFEPDMVLRAMAHMFNQRVSQR